MALGLLLCASASMPAASTAASSAASSAASTVTSTAASNAASNAAGAGAEPAAVTGTADESADATPLFSVSPPPACDEPLCFWANSRAPGASLTLSRTHMVMINPEIVDTTRGIAHITADRGEETGPEIGNSRWTFTGHIRADMSNGQLRADRASVQIVNGRIVSIDTMGSPALFQRPASPAAANAVGGAAGGTAGGAAGGKADFADITVRGHADSISYDAVHDQVQFSGNSWFTDGCNEITSQLVTYDMQTQTIRAGAQPGGNGRVHGVIRNTRPGSSTRCTSGTGHS